MVTAELAVILLNLVLVCSAYFWFYPRVAGADLRKVALFDVLTTALALLIVGSKFWGSGQQFDLVFGNSKPYISSTKSMTGHECWMAGASEVVYSMLMMQHSFIAPNINLEEPDEDSAKLNIARTRIDANIDVFLSNSFGFGGTNSTLIVKKWRNK